MSFLARMPRRTTAIAASREALDQEAANMAARHQPKMRCAQWGNPHCETFRKWRAYPMKGRLVLVAAAVGSLAVAGCAECSSSSSSSSSSASAGGGGSASTKSCVASIGFEGPITGPVAPLGTEQLHFAELAVSMDNAANNTKITLVQGDTQLNPAMAVTVTQQFISNRQHPRRGRPGGQPGSRGRRRPDGPGRDGLHLRVGDGCCVDDRKVPHVLPGGVEGQRAGSAGRELHREDPAPEGPDDRR